MPFGIFNKEEGEYIKITSISSNFEKIFYQVSDKNFYTITNISKKSKKKFSYDTKQNRKLINF